MLNLTWNFLESKMERYFTEIKNKIESLGFSVISNDFERPWGGFLEIDETQA